MKKIINTFKYGDKSTKRVLLMSILMGAVTVALFIAACVTTGMIFFFAAFISVFVTISLAQTLGIRRDMSGENPSPDAQAEEAAEKLSQCAQAEEAVQNPNQVMQAEEAAENLSQGTQAEEAVQNPSPDAGAAEMGETKEQVSGQDNNLLENMNMFLPDADFSEEIYQSETSSKKHKRKKKEKKKAKIEQPAMAGNVETLAAVEPESGRAEKDEKQRINPKAVVSMAADITKKKQLKKVLHKFKVKREHKFIMIDMCRKLKIKQTPAYVWIENNDVKLLVLEKEPRVISFPLYTVNEITYKKKRKCNEFEDYAEYKGNGILANMCKPLLPTYMHGIADDTAIVYKNLYSFGPGINVTNNSAAALFDLFGAEFVVDDRVTQSSKANAFFKEVYKANILLRDAVIDANGYADDISRILDNMAKSTLSYNEFKATLNLMIKNKFITQEFASYYMDVRKENM